MYKRHGCHDQQAVTGKIKGKEDQMLQPQDFVLFHSIISALQGGGEGWLPVACTLPFTCF